MHRFFIARVEETLRFSNDDLHHAQRVLRMRKGERFEAILDGVVYAATLLETEPWTFTLHEEIPSTFELPFELSFFYVIPKGDKWTWVLQKAVEMGVHHLIPVHSTYSVVHWEKEDFERKRNRFEAIVKEATMQSKRTRLMHVHAPRTFDEMVSQSFDQKWIASEHDRQTLIPSDFKILKGSRIAVLVGAEGGFSVEEVTQAKQHQWQPLSLGSRILRTETAALVALAYVTKGQDQ